MPRLSHLAVRVLATVCLLASGRPMAQDSAEEDAALDFGDKESISLATGARQPLRRAPAIATVITAEDIAAMGATDLDEVLETVPGLHVSRAASMGASLYVMRGVVGLNAPQVLLLQNGIPLTVAITGNKGNLWGGLPLENVARIEVLRGPGSALYGADAFAGVINIITKTAGEIPGTETGVRIGSFDTRNGWLQHGGKLGSLDFAGYLRVGRSDGFRKTIAADAQSARDTAASTAASLAPGPVNTGYDALDASLDLANDQWRGRAGYRLRDSLETYAGVGSALDPIGRGKSERITGDLSWAAPKFSSDWGVQAGVAGQQYRQTFPVAAQISPPGTRFPTTSDTFVDGMFGGPEFSERILRLFASASYTGFPGHHVRSGIGHDDLDLYEVREYNNFNFAATGIPIPTGPLALSPTPYSTPHRRRVNYIFAQDEWNFAPDWTLTAGLRHDDYSDFGGTTNPRLALVWDASLDVTAKLLYGSAFRAPQFAELYSANNPIARGNPAIQPELTQTVEAAVAWQARKNLRINLNVFRYDMQDIIRTTKDPAGKTFNNTGGQHGEGMELEINWDWSRSLGLTGQYSQQKSIDESTHQDAGFAPRQHAYARADWRFAAGWQANAQINWVADRRRAAGDARAAVADYHTVDFTIRTSAGNSGWDFALSIRNAFDADAREPADANIPNDLPLPGRGAWAEARYGF